MKRTHARRVAVAATVAIVALVVAGCSGGGDDTGNSTTEGDQTLRLAIQAPPSNFSIGNWSGGDSTLFLSVYDTVIHREVDGTLVPGIAEEWEYNAELTELTLHVRGGIEFTNGEVLDAQAVVDSLEAARTGASTAANLASIASIAATDDATVVVTLSQPDAAIVPMLAGTPGAIGAPSVLTAESSRLEPVGSGPYVLSLDETTAGSDYVLEKSDEFWDADSYPFETIDIKVIADPTAGTNAFKAGQLDYVATTPDEAPQFPENKFTIGNNLPGTLASLWLVDRAGTIVPALKDARVRQAINLAFDRDTMAEKLGPGTLKPTEQVVSPTGGAWSDDIDETYAFDVDKAKELMAEAGYADGFEVTMPSTVLTTMFEPVIAQSLADIGITVVWDAVPFQDFYAKIFGGSYGMFFMYNGYAGSDAVDINASLSGLFNPLQSTTPELQELLAAANVSQAEDAFRDVNAYLVDEAWFAPLAYIEGMYVVPNTVTYTPPLVGNQTVLPWAPAE